MSLLHAAHDWLTSTRLVRQVTDAVLRVQGRRHLALFDRRQPARTQRRILLGLLHQAQGTRFGIDHDFRRIRTEEDYRRLVPLTTWHDLWRSYWEPAFPNLAGATWPGPLSRLAPLDGSVNGLPRHVAFTPALAAAHRSAVGTALAFLVRARPQCRLLHGCVFFLGEDRARSGPEEKERWPTLVRPYAATPSADTNGPALVEQALRRPVTCLVGRADRVVALLEQVREKTGRDDVRGAWPGLAAVLHAGLPGDPWAGRLAQLLPAPVLRLEADIRPEGTVSIEDPRHGLPRLLTDHGLYFEFVPVAERGLPAPRRVPLAGVETGVDYELVLTSPAGWWACRTGRALRFERRDPPLVCFLDPAVLTPPPAEPAPAAEVAAPTAALQAPHRRTVGIPVALPEKFSHTPWLVPSGRG